MVYKMPDLEDLDLASMVEDLLKSANTGKTNVNISLILTNISLSNFTRSPHNDSILIAKTLAIIFGTIGLIANIASLGAIMHIKGHLSSNQKLIVSLVLSDSFVSINGILVITNEILNPHYLADANTFASSVCYHEVFQALSFTGHVISLLNLVSLAFDHYVAIIRPLQYGQVLNARKVRIILSVIWLTSIVVGFSDFLIPTSEYSYCENSHYDNYCTQVYCTNFEPEFLLFPLVFICFVFMTFCYVRVYMKIHQYQSETIRDKRYMRKNIKGLVTTFLILASFLICWLPYVIFEVLFLIQVVTDHANILETNFSTLVILDYYVYNMLLVNSIADPIIYAVRMREVQYGYFRMLRCNQQRLLLRNQHSSRKLYSRSNDFRKSMSVTTYEMDTM